MIENDLERNDYINSLERMVSDEVSLEEFDKMMDSDSQPIVIDLRMQSNEPYENLKQAHRIRMEDFVIENLERIIPDKSAPIVLVCDNSFRMSRMVGLTEYGYPTIKLMGYENVKVLNSLLP